MLLDPICTAFHLTLPPRSRIPPAAASDQFAPLAPAPCLPAATPTLSVLLRARAAHQRRAGHRLPAARPSRDPARGKSLGNQPHPPERLSAAALPQKPQTVPQSIRISAPR